jgi:hypothetical protein
MAMHRLSFVTIPGRTSIEFRKAVPGTATTKPAAMPSFYLEIERATSLLAGKYLGSGELSSVGSIRIPCSSARQTLASGASCRSPDDDADQSPAPNRPSTHDRSGSREAPLHLFFDCSGCLSYTCFGENDGRLYAEPHSCA